MSTTAEFLVRFVSFFFSSRSPIAELRKKTCSAVMMLAATSTSANCSNSATTKTVPLTNTATQLIITDTACRFIPNPRCFVVTSRRVQVVHLFRGRPWFRAQPVDRCFQVRASQARSQPQAIEFARAARFVPHVGLRQTVKIYPVSINHFGDPVGNLGAFPRRPDPIRQQRQRAPRRCIDSARPDHFLWRNSSDGDQKNHQSTDGHS